MLLGLDLGTGSVKALLLDGDGALLGQSSVSYPVEAPRPGWAETDPEKWWEAAARAVREAVEGRETKIEGVGLSGQMHGVVLADDRGNPLRPAILWADSRSTTQLESYRNLGKDARRRLANPPAAGMAGPTLLWLKANEPEIYSSAKWALQPKDWLRMRLTGEASTEPSDASATLLYDLPSGKWDHEVVEALGLRAELLAPPSRSWEVAGSLEPEAAQLFGLKSGLPVAAGAGDTAAAMIGSGLLEAGQAQLTVGTGGQILVPRNHPEPDPHGRTHLYRAAAPDMFYAMAGVQNAGLALEWVRKLLGVSWEEVYEEAFSVLPGADGVTFLPYLSGERTPHLDPGARGAWTGLGLDHGRPHLLRAALEGVAFALRDGVEALEAAGLRIPELRLAGGGATREPWRRLLANVLSRPLLLLPEGIADTASARGAALLAGVACGAFESVGHTLKISPETVERVEPENEVDYETAYRSYGDLYPRLRC